MVEFEWDAGKASLNFATDGVSFAEPMTVFGDPLELTIPDPLHSAAEARFVSSGLSEVGRFLIVAYAERGRRIRIISARQATPRERRQYESKPQT